MSGQGTVKGGVRAVVLPPPDRPNEHRHAASHLELYFVAVAKMKT